MDHNGQHGDPNRVHLQWFADEGNPAQASGEGAEGPGSFVTDLAKDTTGSGASPALQEGAQGGQSATAQGANQATDVQLAGWTAGLTKLLKSDPRIAGIAKFKTMDDAIKAYLELEGKQGGMVAIPTDKSTPEEWAEYHKKIGVPLTPEEYKLDRKPDLKYKDSEEAEFKTWLHKHHVPQTIANDIYQLANEYGVQALQAFQSAITEGNVSVTKSLQKRWGNEYGANYEIAQRGMRAYASKALIDKLGKSELGNDEDLILLFYKIGQLTQEDSAAKRGDAAHPASVSEGKLDYPGL